MMEEHYFLNRNLNLDERSEMLVFLDTEFPIVSSYDIIKHFLFLTLIIFSGACFSITLFSVLTAPMTEEELVLGSVSESESQSEEEEEEEEDEEEDYENKYMDHFEKLEEKELEDEFVKILKERFIEDDTPEGTIIMNYDVDVEAFTYYTDNKNIPYDYLETVGRLYIILNNCKKIFVNYKEEIEKCKEEEMRKKELEEKAKEEKAKKEEEKEEEEKKEKKEKKSVFASFKTYTSEKNGEDKNETFILPENSNRYIYKGKLLDYEQFINKKNAPADEFENIDYNTFKKNN